METHTGGQSLIVSINNLNVSYNDEGSGQYPVILLHGYPFDKSMWDAQVSHLKSSHRVIAYDIRGFGASRDETSPLSLDLFRDDLIQFMDVLNIDKAILCGLSMGGYIALHALKKYPWRFQALILCDTQCVADTPEGKAKRLQSIEDIKAKGTSAFNEGFIKNVFHKDTPEKHPELVAALRTVVNGNSERIITQGLQALADREESCTSLGDIHLPTLILCGRDDVVTPLAQSEFLHAHIKGSILQVIDHAGHVSNLEAADEFNEHLSAFLGTVREKGVGE